jgi:hypothetical protein
MAMSFAIGPSSGLLDEDPPHALIRRESPIAETPTVPTFNKLRRFPVQVFLLQ